MKFGKGLVYRLSKVWREFTGIHGMETLWFLDQYVNEALTEVTH